jgi:hypothetical protein
MKLRTILISSLVGALAVGAAAVAAPSMGSADESQLEMQRIQRMRAVAATGKDVIKVNCVNDKLVLAKPLMNMVDHSQGGAAELRALRIEAEGCVGTNAINVASANSYTAPTIPDSPFANDPWGQNPIEAPAYASPFN